MNTKKIGLRKSDIFVGNRNLTRLFSIDSYLTKQNEEVKNTNSATNAFNCNDIAHNPSQIKNLEPIPLTKKPKSNLHLKLIIIIFSVLITALIVIIIMLSLKSSPDTNTSVCLSSTCIESASKTLSRLDYTIDPCVDFYQFACGKFLKETQLLENEESVDTLKEASHDITKKIMKIINLPITNNASKIRRAIPEIYNKCMNYRTTWDKEKSDLKSLFESLGGWPMVEGKNWNENNFELNKLLLRLKKIGILQRSPFQFTVSLSRKHSDRYALYGFSNGPAMVDESGLSIVYRVALELGGAKSIIIEDLNIISEQAQNMYRNCGPVSISITTLKNLSKWTSVNWTLFVQELFSTTSISITDDEEIFYGSNLVKCMNFFFGLPKRFQANYIFIEILPWILQYLPGMKNNILHVQPTSTNCVITTSQSLSLMVNSLYVKMYFKNETKTAMEQLVTNIRNEFRNVLTTVKWLDSNTRKLAVEKLDAMRVCIGYPDELVDNAKLENYYSSLELNLTTYLSIIQSVIAFELDNALKLLRKSVRNCYWIDASQEVIIVNAYYHLTGNMIKIPAGILQETLFNERSPNYLNYATVGMIIGHEMTHGFDNTGKEFDKNGQHGTWWSSETLGAFAKRTECIVNQYKRYVVPQLKLPVNGELTLGENIADNGGLKYSFLAYKNWVKRQGVEKMLPGLNYTYDQMFWIAFAQFWCSCKSLHQMQREIHTDVHSPNMFRVIGTLSNIQKFADDFNCPIGSPMNPSTKCNVW